MFAFLPTGCRNSWYFNSRRRFGHFCMIKVLCILELCSLFQALIKSWAGMMCKWKARKNVSVICFSAPISSHCLHDLNTWNMLGWQGIGLIACPHAIDFSLELSQHYCLINFVIFVLEDRPHHIIVMRRVTLAWDEAEIDLVLIQTSFLFLWKSC